MATAHIFTKDGVLVASVTDGSVTGFPCDYIGNGRIVMASNANSVKFGNISAKAMSFDRSVSVVGGGSVVQLMGVAVPKDVKGGEDPQLCSSGELVYVLYRVNS